MPSITIKSIPEPLYQRLKHSARTNRRSLNSEALICLEGAFFPRRIDPDAFLARVDAVLKGCKLTPLTDELIRRAKNEGRP
jgi:hypothetical protein